MRQWFIFNALRPFIAAAAMIFVLIDFVLASDIQGLTLTGANNLELVEHPVPSEGLAISFPAEWTPTTAVRNEVIFYIGYIGDVPAGCHVRISEIPNLELVDPDAFFAENDERAFKKLSTISMPDIVIHLYDFGYLGTRKARRMIYSGTDEGNKMGFLVYQTLNTNKIVTLTCISRQEYFALTYGELDQIAYSFRFIN